MATRRAASIDERLNTRLLPVATDPAPQAFVTAKRFGPFDTGDKIILTSTAAFHCVAGDGAVVATTANPIVLAGTHNYVMPDGCTHVSMIDTAAGAGSGQAYLG